MDESANRRWLAAAATAAVPRLGRNTSIEVWRILSAAVEGFIGNDDLLRASALTYTVALSIVPVLALAFSVLKGFGLFRESLIEPYLGFFGSKQVGEQLMGYVERTNAATLGSIGGAFILFTAISTMSTVEKALNTIWRVPRARTYLRKFADYLSVLFTFPVLMVAALTVTAVFSVRISQFPIATFLSPYLITWAAFFLLFVFFPYTTVKYDAALAGSFVAALLFQLAQWGFVRFQIGVAKYQPVYGALASVPFFLVWTYTAWAIVLFGAEVGAAVQHGVRDPSRGPGSRDFPYFAALHILLRVAERHLHDRAPVTANSVARELGVQETDILPILRALTDRGFIVEANADHRSKHQGLFLGRPAASIRIEDVLQDVAPHRDDDRDPRVAGLLARLATAERASLGTTTLEELLSGPRP